MSGNNDEEFVDFNSFVNDLGLSDINNLENQLLYDVMLSEFDDKNTNNKNENIEAGKIYQFQPVTNTNSVTIKQVGYGYSRPTVLLYKTKFKGYLCKLVSFVMTDADIKQAEENCCVPVMSLLFDKKNSTQFVLTLEFHTFDHKKSKTSLFNYINGTLSGFYGVYLKKYKDGKLIKTQLDIIKTMCDKANMAYLLLKYISDERVKNLIINK